MKKTFQIIRVEVPAQETISIIEQLRQDYQFTTGFFVVPQEDTTNLAEVSVSLKIASNEILPSETDISLFCFNDRKSVEQTKYDFREDSIPAKSSEAEFVVSNRSTEAQKFNIYLQLDN